MNDNEEKVFGEIKGAIQFPHWLRRLEWLYLIKLNNGGWRLKWQSSLYRVETGQVRKNE